MPLHCSLVRRSVFKVIHHFRIFSGSTKKGQIFSATSAISIDLWIFTPDRSNCSTYDDTDYFVDEIDNNIIPHCSLDNLSPKEFIENTDVFPENWTKEVSKTSDYSIRRYILSR
ncbi:MAG: hypothetical protein HW402_1130 [Dehalococcoidales bacterium]|nr:hypothetical protein [Dehalococcoidales bacterium]